MTPEHLIKLKEQVTSLRDFKTPFTVERLLLIITECLLDLIENKR